MWPQFRSPLLWDVFAVGTYASVSLVFWYMGMIPDLATFRDRSTSKFRRMVYGILSLGWSGFVASLDALRKGVQLASRPRHAAGFVGAYGR